MNCTAQHSTARNFKSWVPWFGCCIKGRPGQSDSGTQRGSEKSLQFSAHEVELRGNEKRAITKSWVVKI